MVDNINNHASEPVATTFTTITESWIEGRSLTVNGCLIIQCVSGEAQLNINSRNFSFNCGDIAVLTFDMIIMPISKSANFSIRALSVDFNLSQEIFFSATSNRLWDYLYGTPIFKPLTSIYPLYNQWFDFVNELHKLNSYKVQSSIMRKELEIFFMIVCNTFEYIKNNSVYESTKNRAWALSIDFCGLLNRYYSSHHDVAFYANLLNISPNYLNIITRRYSGTTAKEQINLLIILAVKNMLENTSLSIKSIAQRLNYDDPSYLCRIFRKRIGLSPMEYRNKKIVRYL